MAASRYWIRSTVYRESQLTLTRIRLRPMVRTNRMRSFVRSCLMGSNKGYLVRSNTNPSLLGLCHRYTHVYVIETSSCNVYISQHADTQMHMLHLYMYMYIHCTYMYHTNMYTCSNPLR